MSEQPSFEAQRYVDGEMTPDEALAFQARMEKEPALSAEVAEIMRCNDALRLAIPTPSKAHLSRLMEQAEARPFFTARLPLRQIAASVVLLGIGFGAGMQSDLLAPRSPGAGDLLQSATAAHALFAVEVVHPVEVTAGERDHLKGWLSSRLGNEISIPDLQAQGFSLMGGRLLPFAKGGAAQFMYEDAQGNRMTLYLTAADEAGERALAFGNNDGLGLAHWRQDGWHYALVGPLTRARLTDIAEGIRSTPS